jgi:hypothetical protein
MHVYLSPHRDDVCFSIGYAASRLQGHLVNLFTLTRYVAVDMELPTTDWGRVEVVSRLREQEDQLFAEAAGLQRYDLGLWEPALLGYGPFDLTNLEVEVAALSARLMPWLLSKLPSEGDSHLANLYCPMGIGGHRNHVSTVVAVRNAYDTLRQHYTLYLYEDLHYASVARVRQDGLRRATQLFAGMRLSPIVVPINSTDAERKMRLINLYASQHPHAPRAGDFTPASEIESGLHEIVWKVSSAVTA